MPRRFLLSDDFCIVENSLVCDVMTMNFGIVVLFVFTRLYFHQEVFRYKMSIGKVMTLVMLFLSLMILPSFSQATSKREVDYGSAIEDLVKLGFPDVEGAKYVKLNDQSLRYIQGGFSSLGSKRTPKLSGNGFYIASKDDPNNGNFISLAGVEMRYTKKRVHKSNRHSSGYYGGGMGMSIRNVSGERKIADLKKDIEVIQTWALKQTLDSSFRYNASRYYSVALRFAGLAHQAGMKNEANELIKVLFLNHENPEELIDKLLGDLAEEEYNKCYAEFNAKGDWLKYHADLLRIQEKYPRGWENQPGLSLLIPLVKKRVDSEPVKFPTIEGHTFSDEITTLLRKTGEVSKKPTQAYYGGESLFLIDKAEKNDKLSAMAQLTHYGMDGFIALVALIGDDTLVMGNEDNSDSYGMSYGYSGSYNDEGKSVEDAYNSLSKPQTRGQLAEQIIRGTLPHNSEELSEIQGEQLKVMATQWWRVHKDDKKIDLIKHYFEHGNQSHANNLGNILIKQNTVESRKLLEDGILKNELPENLSSLVKIYVKKRRANAKDFVLKYQEILLAKIGEATSNDNEYNAYQIVEAGGTRKYIASLLMYTGELKPDELFLKLANKGSNTTEIMEMLSSIYSGKKLSTVLNKFIQIAAQTEDTRKQGEILRSLYSMMFEYGEQPEELSAEDVKNSKQIKLTDAEKKEWEVLLSLNTVAGYMSNSYMSGMILDKYLNPEMTVEEYEPMWNLGQEVASEIMRARSMDLLKGEKVEPLPNIKLVSENDKKKILSRLEDVEPVNYRAMYETLNYSERLVVMSNPINQIKFKEAGAFIKGFSEKEDKYKIGNRSELEALLKTMLDAKVGAETYAKLTNIIIDKMVLFEGVSVSPRVSRILPGSDLFLSKTALYPFPVLEKAIEELVAGERETFVALVAIANIKNRRGGDQEPLVHLFDKGTIVDAKKLAGVSKTDLVTITAVTKNAIKEWKKDQVNGKEEMLDELIKIQPSFQDMRSQFQTMEIQELKDVLDQMRNKR